MKKCNRGNKKTLGSFDTGGKMRAKPGKTEEYLF